jgi:ABC-2 type transport system permease protein
MMKRILLTIKAVIKDNLSSKATWFFIIFFPLFLTLIFALGFGAGTQVHQYVVVNDQQLGKYINQSELFTALYGINEREALLRGYIFVNATNETVNIYYPQNDKYLVPSLEAIITGYYDKSSPVNFNAHQSSANAYYVYVVSGMIGIIALSNGVFGVTGVASGYYRDKLIDRLAASPLRSYEWVVSLVIYEIVITLISTVPILLLSIAFGVIPIVGVAFLGFLVISTLMFSGLGAIIFGLTPKDKLFVANVAANVITIPLMFLSTAFFTIDAFPSILRPLVEYQPVSVIDAVIRDVMVYGRAPSLFDMFYIVLLTLAFIAVGSKLMRLRETD